KICGSSCVNTTDDPKNCGSCGTVCSSDSCLKGRCVVHADSIWAYQKQTCIVYQGKLKCWGENDQGQLGYNHQSNIFQPSDKFVELSGDKVQDIGFTIYSSEVYVLLQSGHVRYWKEIRNSLPQKQNIAFFEKMTQISKNKPIQLSASSDHICMIFQHGDLRCWGFNTHGQLGYGSTTDIREPTVQPVDLIGAKAVQVATGSGHTCVLLEQGSVKCWGFNLWGQLGYGDNARMKTAPLKQNVDLLGAKAVQVATGSGHTCVLLEQGSVKCWGSNGSGELGYGDQVSKELKPPQQNVDLLGRKVKQVATGNSHTCVVLREGSIKCWGFNLWGQLGYPDNKRRYLPETKPLWIGGRTVKSIACGDSHTCVLMDDKSIYCWGENTEGRLGHIHSDPLALPVLELSR
ncbi:MAG: hypothetical protein AAGJ35_00595, partial [Myxococcota bacterium]